MNRTGPEEAHALKYYKFYYAQVKTVVAYVITDNGTSYSDNSIGNNNCKHCR